VARPGSGISRLASPTIRGVSTYTVLGFAGYAVASALGAALAIAWQLPLADRLVAMFAPPLAFLAVVAANRRYHGRERIVFYQTASAGVVSAGLASLALGGHAPRVVDVATAGIGAFLVFGRAGCFSVACCHGRPARHGIAYGPAHVAVGFWSRWAGRTLWPVQLVEGAASAALVAIALVAGWDAPGLPARIYILGYAYLRFALELVRGDAARPHALGLSEAQWTALATVAACAAWRPTAIALAASALLTAAAAALIALRGRRALHEPPHLHELDRACLAAQADGARHDTSLGVAVSVHALPDGRRDFVLSSTDPRWSLAAARHLADALWTDHEVHEGRLPGVVHVIRAP
jgi:hypothetical protein